MTIVLRISGIFGSKIESVLLIFCNDRGSYPINCVPDILEKVSYSSNLSFWMSEAMFLQILQEPRALGKPHLSGNSFIFTDNCSGHNKNAEVLSEYNAINVKLCKFLANSMHFCQNLDSFVIRSSSRSGIICEIKTKCVNLTKIHFLLVHGLP